VIAKLRDRTAAFFKEQLPRIPDVSTRAPELIDRHRRNLVGELEKGASRLFERPTNLVLVTPLGLEPKFSA
jgi:hypothetical protein